MPVVELDIRAQLTKLTKGLKDTQTHVKQLEGQVSKSTKNVESNFKKAGTQVQKFAGYMGLAFGGAIVIRGIKKQIDMFKEFEKTMANVLTLLSATQKQQFGTFLKAGAARLMGEYGLAIQDVNKALFDTISAGVSAGDSIEFLDQAARLAIGGVTNLSTAVDGMTSVLNAYGLAATEAEKISSAFFTAQKYGKTTVEELAQNIGQVAPIAKNAGISFQELLSAMALLTKQGIRTDMASTALRATITALINPSKQASDMFEKLGIRSGTTALREEGLAKTLLAVAKAASTDADVLSELIPNVRALTGVAALGEDALAEFAEILKEVTEDFGENSSLANALEEQMTTLEEKINRAGGAWRNFILSITEQQEGAATDVINLWTWLFNKMAEKNREVYKKMGMQDQEYISDYIKEMKKGASEVGLALSVVAAQRAKNTLIGYQTELMQFKALKEEEEEIRKTEVYGLKLSQIKRLEAIEEEKKALAESMIIKSELILALKEESERALKEELEAKRKAEEEKEELYKENFEAWKELEQLRIQAMDKGLKREIASEELKYQIELNKYKDNLEAKELLYEGHLLRLREISMKYPLEVEEELPSLLPPIEFTEDQLSEHEALMKQWQEGWEEINDETTEATALQYSLMWKDLTNEQKQYVQSTIQQASAMFGALGSLYNAQMQEELKREGLNEAQKESIRRKYYKKEQDAAVLQAIISGAVGIVKAFEMGPILGIIFGALVAATTAIQIATIKSQKFAKGTYQVLKGARHAQGGIDVGIGEAEDGEGMAIFSREARKKYGSVLPDLVRAINDRKLGMMNLEQTERFGRKADLMMHRVSLDDSKDLKAIRRLLEKQQISERIEGNYRIVEKPGLIKKYRLK